MAPSAPLSVPAPPAPLTAFLEVGGIVHPSDGSESSTDDILPGIVAGPKLPGKSNLKRQSMFGSSEHLVSRSGQNEYGLMISNMVGNEASVGEQLPKAAPAGNGVDVVVVSTEDYIQYKRKDSRVTWTDNHGKDLAEIWEFEPSDTNDSDDETDSESSQACSCVIQ